MGEQQEIPVLAHEVMQYVFESIIKKTDVLLLTTKYKCPLSARRPAPLTISLYIARIKKYAECPEEIFVASMIYMDKIVKRNPCLLITSQNVHRLVMLCVVVADKFWNDAYLSNKDYATVGGLTIEELNELEHVVLALLGFELYIDDQAYEDYCWKLRRLWECR